MSDAPKKARKPQIPDDWPQPLPQSQDALDQFIDALLLEDGLSRNTLSAYRRDLTATARWLARLQPPKALDAALEGDLQGYFTARVEGTKATSSNRRLTVLRRYFHWALREKRIAADPTVRMLAAKQPPRMPKTLTQEQVEALLDAPDVDTRWACAIAPCWS
jgi:integrase/recombinase XerD